jgi:TatD DNase family protein
MLRKKSKQITLPLHKHEARCYFKLGYMFIMYSTTPPFLDFHNHQQCREDRTDIIEIVSLHLGKDAPHYYYTIGKHPWWTEAVLSQEEEKQLTRQLSNEHCLAMGEMGLDNLKGPAMPLQMDILRSQLRLARELAKPVIIHCVRAYDQLLQIKKEFPEIKQWCIHGFARHEVLAQQLIDKGFYLSLMPVGRLTDKYQKLLLSLPPDRFFLETDSMPNILIEDIYLQAAAVLGVGVEDLKKQLMGNAKVFFGY